MQGGEDKMAGERRLNGNGGGLAVADLADQNDVGILAENRAQRRCEGEARLFVDLNLDDASDAILDRVLDGYDVDAAMLEQTQGSVKRCRFA